MNLKSTYFFLFVGIGITSVILVLLFLARFKETNNDTTQPILPTPTIVQSKKGTRVVISDVSMVNPLENPIKKTKQGDAVFAMETTYQLVFLPTFNEFLITITTPLFASGRKEAEEAFLEKLDISKEDACLLKVTIGTPAAINPSEAGKSYPLSFCQ